MRRLQQLEGTRSASSGLGRYAPTEAITGKAPRVRTSQRGRISSAVATAPPLKDIGGPLFVGWATTVQRSIIVEPGPVVSGLCYLFAELGAFFAQLAQFLHDFRETRLDGANLPKDLFLAHANGAMSK